MSSIYIDVKKNLWFVGANDRQSVLDIYIPKSGKKSPLLIFLHGFKGFKDWGHFPLICKAFANKGLAVLSFNFSHNGGTVENPIDFPDLEAFSENTYSKELEDVSLILEWITKHKSTHFGEVDLANISILGHSRGGGIALLAANRLPEIKSVITWASVADYKKRLPKANDLSKWKEAGVRFIKNGRTHQDMPMKYTFVEDLMQHEKELSIEIAVKSLNKAQLIVHGRKDETVSIESAEQLNKWNPTSELLIIEGENHTFSGKHPFQEENLPNGTQIAVDATFNFITSRN